MMNDSQFLQEIGARIKKLRIEKNISQNELAMMCEFEKASMSRIESGQTNTTILTLRKICSALDLHICDLMEDREDRRPK
jgi:transcriptional regulator with XRE-family HTH domain